MYTAAGLHGPRVHPQWRNDHLRVKEIVMLITLVFVTILALESNARPQLCGLREQHVAREVMGVSATQADGAVGAIRALQLKALFTGKLYRVLCECGIHEVCPSRGPQATDLVRPFRWSLIQEPSRLAHKRSRKCFQTSG
jgi:hypothetical protein